MSQKFYTVLTKIGEAKYANSTALKVPMRLTTLAVGDGGGATPAPTRDASRLVRELRRAPLNSLTTDPNNPGQFIAEQIIPAEIGGWWIREMGIYDADGDLIAIGNCPDTYKPLLAEGSGRTQIIRMIMQFGSDALIELKIDPAVVLATRQYVDTGLKAHREEADPHPQYLTPAELDLAMVNKADKHNAVLTGAPVAPTAAEGTATEQLATTKFVNTALGKAAGLPLLFPLWCPNRAAIPAGYAPADGQALSRSLYPDAWAGIAAGNVPVATDAAWLATPTERGKCTAGDGAGTFRLPDYNGKSAGSLGALFLRGDGTLSAQTDGVIQPDELRSHTHPGALPPSSATSVVSASIASTRDPRSGTVDNTGTTTGASGGTETRPLNVTGCWVIRLFGAVVNPGAADAAQLATEVSKLGADKVPFAAFLGANQSLASSGYQKQPGGLILQWGVLATPGVNTTMPVTFPVSFPAACRFVGLSGIAGTIVGGSDGGCYATSLTSAGFGLVNGWDGGINPATVYWFAIGY